MCAWVNRYGPEMETPPTSQTFMPEVLIQDLWFGSYRGNIEVIFGLYSDNGKENGNYYLGFRVLLSPPCQSHLSLRALPSRSLLGADSGRGVCHLVRYELRTAPMCYSSGFGLKCGGNFVLRT